MPGEPSAGPMHKVPRLQWKTWVRLAFVEAGSDWRSLNRLAVKDGQLSDYLIVPEYRSGYLGVQAWSDTSGTIAGRNTPSNGAYSVADPRPPAGPLFSKYKVTRWDRHTGTVIGGDDQGAYAVADPRPSINRQKGDHYLTGGHYGVVPWNQPSYAVSGAACHDNGHWSVADPRLPKITDKLVAFIQAFDGTWHRPFTTLELAAIQGLLEPEEYLELEGLNDGAWRERIGNAVPPPAAEAIASVMGETLLLAWSGETFVLGSTPIWAKPMATALALSQ